MVMATSPPEVGTPETGGLPALVHDYMLVMRGAERTFASIADCWPSAPVYTLLYDPSECGDRFRHRPVVTSRLQHLRVGQRDFRRLLPLMPRAAESLPVGDHRLIVSSSSAFAHGVRPGDGAVHICYSHSPFRYVWHERERARAEIPWPAWPLARRMLDRIRRWDLEAAARVTHYIANSQITRERIAQYYGREATVVHPPVEVERFAIGTPEDYVLTVGELTAHKRIELALEAARLAGVPIKVVGTGPDEARLRREFGGTAEFCGRVSDDELARLYSGAKALILPNTEEFGIAAVEGQAAGRPVVAVNRGGARETVIDGETGVLVPPEDPPALAEALRYTDFDRFSPPTIKENAHRFSSANFRRSLHAEVARVAGGTAGVSSPAEPLPV
jgi:glycosyltransferase involved in cell wall biosynthesis